MAPDKARVTTPKSTRTCDLCRARKIKCVTYAEDPERPCEGCTKLGTQCTYDYVKKKPGRKNSFSPRTTVAAASEQHHHSRHARASTSASASSITTTVTSNNSRQESTPPSDTAAAGTGTGFSIANFAPDLASGSTPHRQNSSLNNAYSLPSSSNAFVGAPPIPPFSLNNATDVTNSSHHSLQHHQQQQHPHPHKRGESMSTGTVSSSDIFSTTSGGTTNTQSSFSLPSLESTKTESDPSNLSWLDSILEGAGSWGSTTNILSDIPEATMSIFPSDSALLDSQSPNFSLASTSSAQDTISQLLHAPKAGERQLEDVTTWANISHFISLYLQHLYPLLPLVHRPKFAEHMAMRRDLRDPGFRALLLSIVAFVISQVPTTRLVNDQFDIESLKRLQRQCYRTCRTLQRTSHSPTSLTQVNTLIFETFYLLSVGLSHIAGSRLGQAIQLAFSMGLNSDAKTEGLGLDTIEIQLRRRTFWQLYATDKTRAISGLPMLINDFQGVCSLPEPIDDEFITSQGYFFQPRSQVSVMVGFVGVSKVFRILSEVFFYHRCLSTGFDKNISNFSLDWTITIEHRLHQILNELPNEIMQPMINSTESFRQVFAMQRANILITIACCKFALYDLRAALNDNEAQLKLEKEGIAREMHSLLMGIPVEDLASNGESVRAKVFHIVTALCTQVPATDLNYDLVRDWCNMFFAISFVQMPPPPPENLGIDSRAPTPPAQLEAVRT